ncbi:MAG TPA: hypothetical protein PLC72_09775, partial [Candidatus Hydrogenedentes bacterium]|nr:hypothetical protein [Candidatus Hydrogenedentota bacterium]
MIAQAIEDIVTSCFDYDYKHAHEHGQNGGRMYLLTLLSKRMVKKPQNRKEPRFTSLFRSSVR